jgi:hypothetical protein
MKRPVSFVVSLVLILGTSACGDAAAGKPQIAGACSSKTGSEQGCACLADALEKNLTPEEFGQVAKAMDDNRRFSDLLPGGLSGNAKIAGAFTEATQACFA